MFATEQQYAHMVHWGKVVCSARAIRRVLAAAAKAGAELPYVELIEESLHEAELCASVGKRRNSRSFFRLGQALASCAAGYVTVPMPAKDEIVANAAMGELFASAAALLWSASVEEEAFTVAVLNPNHQPNAIASYPHRDDVLGFSGGSLYHSRNAVARWDVNSGEFFRASEYDSTLVNRAHPFKTTSVEEAVSPTVFSEHSAFPIENILVEGEGALSSPVRKFTDDLLARFALDPDALYDLEPRAFEELVADLWGRLGYDVRLTPISRDGGYDILAVNRKAINELFLIECKRYSSENRVDVGVVRKLAGTVHDFTRSHSGLLVPAKGIVATTSWLTAPAKDFIGKHKLIFGESADFDHLQRMLVKFANTSLQDQVVLDSDDPKIRLVRKIPIQLQGTG